jgi:hypothetical protein
LLRSGARRPTIAHTPVHGDCTVMPARSLAGAHAHSVAPRAPPPPRVYPNEHAGARRMCARTGARSRGRTRSLTRTQEHEQVLRATIGARQAHARTRAALSLARPRLRAVIHTPPYAHTPSVASESAARPSQGPPFLRSTRRAARRRRRCCIVSERQRRRGDIDHGSESAGWPSSANRVTIISDYLYFHRLYALYHDYFDCLLLFTIIFCKTPNDSFTNLYYCIVR